jgi:hypothetical protein
LTGHVVVLEGGRARALTLGVRFYEQSPAHRFAPLDQSIVIHEGDLATGGAVPFRFRLPESALPGVKGGHCELFWELEVVADVQGQDARARRRFEVRAGTP